LDRQKELTERGVGLAFLDTTIDPVKGQVNRIIQGNKWTHHLRRLVNPSPSNLLEGRLRPRMSAILQGINPDAIFLYHWHALAATYRLKAAPRVAGVSDLWHLPGFRRWQDAAPRLTPTYVKWSLKTLADLHYYPKAMVAMLNDCEAYGCFHAQAAAWLRRRGADRCAYWRTPIVDRRGPGWQELRDAVPPRSRPNILLGPSNLRATSMSAGLRLFAREILPRLERELGAEGFEVDIVGEGDPPPELVPLLARPSVRLRGRIEPLDAAFLSADIQLVPTPFVLGVRVRIIEGFSFGCCVVAHANDAFNMPEMVHEHNALLAPDGRRLAEAVIRAARDPALRRQVGANGRRTYEQYFSPERAASPIVDELEQLARGYGKAPSTGRA